MIVFLLAFLVEALVEAVFGKPIDHKPKLQPYKWCLAYIAFAVGIAGAWIYRFDVMFLLGDWLQAPVPVTPFGITVTRLVIGRGSNSINDLVSRFFNRT